MESTTKRDGSPWRKYEHCEIFKDDAAARDRQEFLHQPMSFPSFTIGLYLGIFVGCFAASALTSYIGNMTIRQDADRLSAEVRKCPGDYVRLVSGRHICRVPTFWRKIQPAG